MRRDLIWMSKKRVEIERDDAAGRTPTAVSTMSSGRLATVDQVLDVELADSEPQLLPGRSSDGIPGSRWLMPSSRPRRRSDQRCRTRARRRAAPLASLRPPHSKIEEMGRARDARVVAADQLLESVRRLGVGQRQH